MGEDNAVEADLDEERGDYHAPKPKTAARKAKSKITAKAKGPPPAKKPRLVKATDSKPSKTTVRRAKKPKESDDAYDAAQVAKDTKIAADNPLFSAFLMSYCITCPFLIKHLT
jgi:cohesin complex subunit SA-1/2